MTRRSPKLLVLIAAVLTLALLAFVFAGGGSRGGRLPKDRLTDEQAKAPSAPARQLPDLSAIVAGNDATAEATPPPPEPPPAEPEVEPGPATQRTPIVRPAPPTTPRRSAKAETRTPVKPDVRKTKPKAVASDRSRPSTTARTANAPAPARVAAVRPSYNCRYARTRSEVAVCSDTGLAGLDRQMAAQFGTAYRQGTAAQREVLERSRLRFLYRRDRCQSASCIAAAYRARMSEINDIAARNWRQP